MARFLRPSALIALLKGVFETLMKYCLRAGVHAGPLHGQLCRSRLRLPNAPASVAVEIPPGALVLSMPVVVISSFGKLLMSPDPVAGVAVGDDTLGALVMLTPVVPIFENC